jgi:hypothetical protein
MLAGCTKAKDTSTTGQSGDVQPQTGTFSAIDIPVYPGSTVEPDKSVSMNNGGNVAKIDYYLSKDDTATVIAWYKAQLPSNWTNMGDPSDTTSGSFASPGDPGNQQAVTITSGGSAGGTEIQLATKTSSGSGN